VYRVAGEIGQYPGDSPEYLLRISEDGQIVDANHETREEAIDRAQWEFEVFERLYNRIRIGFFLAQDDRLKGLG
jgi:hypothetical protein